MQIGKIFLNFNKEKTLIALAIFENGYCSKFFVLTDLTNSLFEKYRCWLQVPESLTGDNGLLGLSTNIYKYLSDTLFEGEIVYTKLIDFDLEDLVILLKENQNLKSLT